MTYQLLRLRLHGLIERVPQSRRYQATEHGLCIALWFTRWHVRLLRPALGDLLGTTVSHTPPLRRALEQFELQLDRHIYQAHVTSPRPKTLDSHSANVCPIRGLTGSRPHGSLLNTNGLVGQRS